MSREALAAAWARPTRRRAARDDALLALPLVLVAAAIGWRLAGLPGVLAAGLLAAAAVALAIRWRTRRFDRRWLVAALDARRDDLEDSTDLLFADPAALGPLQRLQRERVAARLAAAPIPELAPARDRRLLGAAALAGTVAAAAIVLWPRPAPPPLAPAAEGLAAVPGVPRLVAQRLEVVPPAYTGLPPSALGRLDARVPAGSRLAWTLRFAPDPAAAALEAVARAPLPLSRAGETWRAGYLADRPLLYRVVPRGAERAGVPPLHRIDVIADRPPQVRAEAPRATLTMLSPGQRSLSLAFTATDDYGVAATARLRLVVAQGEGENVRFSERTVTLSGSGPARSRRFATVVSLAALGFTEPGDLVAQLTVSDTRAPGPQVVRGPSVILRRPPARGAEGSGLEGMTRRVMPAYFRSQRQIIIDAEALIRERPRPAADRFLARSDAIGADQRLLRLRYGQFMGEETGGGATMAMPTNDEEEEVAAPAAAATPAADAHHADDGHDHPPGAAATFGDAGNALEQFGHTHDESEAATLLDPGTRATLRQALDNMWQSELALRQGAPAKALPYAYKALRFIKQVQQATRIFLNRTGTQQPAIDLSRRLTGTRGAMGGATLPSAAADPVDAAPAAIWAALDTPRWAEALAALERWSRSGARIADPLALAGAIDAVRREPGCARCRAALKAELWRSLPRPAPGLARRDAGGAVGRRYLDALR